MYIINQYKETPPPSCSPCMSCANIHYSVNPAFATVISMCKQRCALHISHATGRRHPSQCITGTKPPPTQLCMTNSFCVCTEHRYIYQLYTKQPLHSSTVLKQWQLGLSCHSMLQHCRHQDDCSHHHQQQLHSQLAVFEQLQQWIQSPVDV
jgi:hypothetical protein